MEKYRLPVRTQRALDERRTMGKPPKELTPLKTPPITRMPHRYSKRDIYGTTTPAYLAARNFKIELCDCGSENTSYEDGYEVCMSCALVGGSVKAAPPVWHGTHSIIKKHFYDPSNYMKVRLKRLSKGVPGHAMRKLEAVFPTIYRAFFKCVPHRKNFMDYGFVIKRLLELQGLDPERFNIKSVVTPSKIRDCQMYWKLVMCKVDIHI